MRECSTEQEEMQKDASLCLDSLDRSTEMILPCKICEAQHRFRYCQMFPAALLSEPLLVKTAVHSTQIVVRIPQCAAGGSIGFMPKRG
jgi:hypothetical protein